MLWVPRKGKLLTQHNISSLGAVTQGTSLSTGGASSTKGTAVEVFASTSFDAYCIEISATDYTTSGTATQGCLDVLIGAATEEVLIPNLLMGNCGGWVGNTPGDVGPKRWEFPIYIPAGSRIAVQAAGLRLSTALRVQIWLRGGYGYPPFNVGSKVITYGIGTVPAATAITPGASGAEGSWTQITASTSEDHFAFVPSLQGGGDIALNNRNLTVDLGIGAATEEEIMEAYNYFSNTSEVMGGPFNAFPCFHEVPSGTRLAARVSASGTLDDYQCAIHAVS